jgi:RNA polymerase sigma-70 factor (ECF subfamily)
MTDRTDDAELRLLGGVADGDRQALTDLYLLHRQALFHYLLHFTPDYGLAEELLQDTFVAVWKNAGSFGGKSRVRAWLFGIARNRACKTIRRHGNEAPAAGMHELEALPTSDPEPEAALLARATREDVAAAIEQLTPTLREVLLLSFVHELAYAEIAEVLGVPVGTVKSRLSNAKRALRTLLSADEEANR